MTFNANNEIGEQINELLQNQHLEDNKDAANDSENVRGGNSPTGSNVFYPEQQ